MSGPVDERHYDYVQTRRAAPAAALRLVSPEVQAITDRTWPRPRSTRHARPRRPVLRGVPAAALLPRSPRPSFLRSPDHLDEAEGAARVRPRARCSLAAFLLWRLSPRVAPRAPLLAFSAALTVLLWPACSCAPSRCRTRRLELVLATALLLVLWRLLEQPARAATASPPALLLGACLLRPSRRSSTSRRSRRAWRVARLAQRGGTRAGRRRPAAIPALMLCPWLIFNLDHYDALTASTAARDQQAPVVNPLGLTYGTADALATGRAAAQGGAAGGVAGSSSTSAGCASPPWSVFAALFGVALALRARRRRRAGRGGRCWFFAAAGGRRLRARS